jgi:diaminohydroxyphosphoribosylaminopyrimidine deaminase/5-amino-6-(5-phosphoribosylamino)uracil reductase
MKRSKKSLADAFRQRAQDEFFMQAALEEAARGIGRTSPNPTVGAVVVVGGRIISRAYHPRAGEPHAEVLALRHAGAAARGGDLYTSLEPCDHHGRTPPCSEEILRAGIRRVIAASRDPNPKVNGKGLRKLQRAGVQILTGVLKPQADALNRPFFKVMAEGLPYVTLKVAATLDGKLATHSKDSRWVSGPLARERVQRMRDEVDAVLVGNETAAKDNPRLTTRFSGGRDPARIVLDSQLKLRPSLRLFTQRSSAPTIVATLLPQSSKGTKALVKRGVEVWTCPGQGGRVALKPLLERLAASGRNHLLVEGGATVLGEFLRQRMADELYLFTAPKILGAESISWVGKLGIGRMAKAMPIYDLSVERVGPDFLFHGWFHQDKGL